MLAVLELFASQSGLRERDDFSVSCLPGNGRAPKRKCRASVVSVGWVEVLVVELDRSHGGIAQVSVWGEPNEDITWAAELAGVSIQSSRLDGGGIALRLPGAMALKLLSDDKVAQLVSRRISAIRDRRRRSRRLDWHNSWLWAFLDACVASPRSGCSVDDWDVSRSDSVVLAYQRNSQSDFRRRLLESGPVECAICGLDLPELLEAAHLVPHARGGQGKSGERSTPVCKPPSGLRRRALPMDRGRVRVGQRGRRAKSRRTQTLTSRMMSIGYGTWWSAASMSDCAGCDDRTGRCASLWSGPRDSGCPTVVRWGFSRAGASGTASGAGVC